MSKRDVGASVRQRLLNQARAQGRPFQEVLQYFAMERFLYRLAKSPFADRFILKGALLLTAWRAPLSRPTMDIDLAGRTDNALDHVASLVGEVCAIAVEPDGIEFSRASIEASRIKEDVAYEGVRVQFHATLARARIPMQLDIGFGDIITPGPAEIEYPTLLDFPAPVLQAYPRETVVAEKLEALTALGVLNSRMKDYYDLALLSRMYPFEGERLADAIVATFRHRGTTIEAEPIGLTEAYYNDPARAVQWRAFVRRSRFDEEAGDLSAARRRNTTVRAAGAFRNRGERQVASAMESGWPLGMRSEFSGKKGSSWPDLRSHAHRGHHPSRRHVRKRSTFRTYCAFPGSSK